MYVTGLNPELIFTHYFDRSLSWRHFCYHKSPTIFRKWVYLSTSDVFIAKIWIGYLAESPFLDDLDHIIECFDKTTKLKFQNIDGPQYIKFGSTRDNDPACNIRFGQLKLPGCVLAVLFEHSQHNLYFLALDLMSPLYSSPQ